MKAFIKLLMMLLLMTNLAFAESARDIVERSYNYMRGDTSVAVLEMKIHRPDFERHLSMKAWSKGRSDGVFFITKPKRDAGNGTLKKGQQMWMYNPNINRVIKLPPSMMAQSWMGSDFSNNDLSKTESMIDDYNHFMLSETNGVFTIQSTPKDGAAVVWGRVDMVIRADGVLMSQKFYDQEMVPVKELVTSDIANFGGKLFPKTWIMRNLEEADRYTSIKYIELEFNTPLPDSIFTTTYMKSMGD